MGGQGRKDRQGTKKRQGKRGKQEDVLRDGGKRLGWREGGKKGGKVGGREVLRRQKGEGEEERRESMIVCR